MHELSSLCADTITTEAKHAMRISCILPMLTVISVIVSACSVVVQLIQPYDLKFTSHIARLRSVVLCQSHFGVTQSQGKLSASPVDLRSNRAFRDAATRKHL